VGLIDFELDVYDYATFVLLIVLVLVFFYAMITLGGLPGKLAERRNHPHADSVKLGGWIGLFTVFPWIHALIWAYHDSMTVDVRKFPKSDGNEPVSKAEDVSEGPHEVQPVPASRAGYEPAKPTDPEPVQPEPQNPPPGDKKDGASS